MLRPYITEGHNKTHIAWSHVSSFLFNVQCFYRDENDITPDDQHYINKREKEHHLCFGNVFEER